MLLNDDDEPPLKKYLLYSTIAYVAVMVFSIVQYVIIDNNANYEVLAKYRVNLKEVYSITHKNGEPYCSNVNYNLNYCESEKTKNPNKPNICTPTWFYGSDLI